MAAFHHGISAQEVVQGILPMRNANVSVIGLVVTSTDADADMYPLDTPVLLTGITQDNIDKSGTTGTLRNCLQTIRDIHNPTLVILRVDAVFDVDLLDILLTCPTRFGLMPKRLGAPEIDTPEVVLKLVSIAKDRRAIVYASPRKADGSLITDNAEIVAYRDTFGDRELCLIDGEWGVPGKSNPSSGSGGGDSTPPLIPIDPIEPNFMGMADDYSGSGWYKAIDTGIVYNKGVPDGETKIFEPNGIKYVSVYTKDDAKSLGARAAVSNVTDMQYLFVGDVNFNQDISSWDVSNVTNMIGMFGGAANFNQDISSWDVSSVLYMSEMFQDAANFNQDISSWDVSNVITMEMMFMRAYSFNQDISSWNVSSVITMRRIFYQTGSFNQDISPWNVSSVIDMSDMFYGAHSFNQDISPWNVSNVENMSGMFACDIFNQDLSEWCVELVSEKPQSGFDLGENPAWALPKPVWGTCPRDENIA